MPSFFAFRLDGGEPSRFFVGGAPSPFLELDAFLGGPARVGFSGSSAWLPLPPRAFLASASAAARLTSASAARRRDSSSALRRASISAVRRRASSSAFRRASIPPRVVVLLPRLCAALRPPRQAGALLLRPFDVLRLRPRDGVLLPRPFGVRRPPRRAVGLLLRPSGVLLRPCGALRLLPATRRASASATRRASASAARRRASSSALRLASASAARRRASSSVARRASASAGAAAGLGVDSTLSRFFFRLCVAPRLRAASRLIGFFGRASRVLFDRETAGGFGGAFGLGCGGKAFGFLPGFLRPSAARRASACPLPPGGLVFPRVRNCLATDRNQDFLGRFSGSSTGSSLAGSSLSTKVS